MTVTMTVTVTVTRSGWMAVNSRMVERWVVLFFYIPLALFVVDLQPDLLVFFFSFFSCPGLAWPLSDSWSGRVDWIGSSWVGLDLNLEGGGERVSCLQVHCVAAPHSL